MKNFVQPTVTASAGGVTSGDLIVAATLPVLDPIDTAMKAAGCGQTAGAPKKSERPRLQNLSGLFV